jgi:L-alanine-DL-glutamate epimerase-like enolase superfamily enzyme
MTTITAASAFLVDIPVETVRTDAVQSFIKQETIFVSLTTSDGFQGLGYSYTIGTGGSAVLAMLRDNLLPRVIGQDSSRIDAVWNDVYYSTRATTTGLITSLAVAAIDTALWDIASKRHETPLWKLAGGHKESVPLYDTEGGWLHISQDELVTGALESKEKGLTGVKLKIGKPSLQEDVDRLSAVREAIGSDMNIMVDANQSMTLAEAKRRAQSLEPVQLFWLEEPMPADDVAAHQRLVESTTIPIAVGESMYSMAQFQQYVAAGAATIVQVDVARVGGITPWLKVAHMAETANVKVCPHFLMELHVSLAAAVPNGLYVEHIPQLTQVVKTTMTIRDGHALVPETLGLGIDWDMDALERMTVA